MFVKRYGSVANFDERLWYMYYQKRKKNTFSTENIFILNIQ